MADNIKQTMQKAEKLAMKIKKKARRADIDYSVQVSMSSTDPGVIYYALQLTPLADGLAPMTFIKKTPEDLITAIEAQIDNLDEAYIEKAYHEAQITHAERTIKFHQERIVQIQEEQNAPKEAEIVEDVKAE